MINCPLVSLWSLCAELVGGLQRERAWLTGGKEVAEADSVKDKVAATRAKRQGPGADKM